MMYTETVPTKLQQGCLVESVFFDAVGFDLQAVVMSPACDFENEKADYATCIALLPFGQEIEKFRRGSWKDFGMKDDQPNTTPSGDQIKKLRKSVKELMGGQMARYHWFDALDVTSGPLIADFQLVTSVSKKRFEKLKIVAALTPQFMEQLPARWTSYAGRIGTPDREQADLERSLTYAQRLFFEEKSPAAAK